MDLNAAAELPAGEPPPYGEGETAAHISAARELAEKGDFASLYAADQLSRCQARGEAFGGFTDATPTGFAPTFKVRRQSGTVYKEQRVPSYCDRVLWKSMPPLARCVSKLSFDSLPQVSTSDHKPVLATFAVTPTELMGASPSGMAQGPDAREVTGRDEKKKIGTFRHGSRRPPPASLLLSSSASLRKMSASMTHQLPLIRIQSLQLVGMKDADVGGGSDPYCIFLSNPLDLFSVGGRVPISTVKHTDRRYSALTRGLTLGAIALSPTNLAKGFPSWSSADADASGAAEDGSNGAGAAAAPASAPAAPAIDSAKSTGAGGDGADDVDAPRRASAFEEASKAKGTGGGGGMALGWAPPELPLLRPRLADFDRLRWCTLVIAIYDQDRIGDDDLLGMVMVPLAPPGESNGGVEATQPLQPLPEEYTIDIDQPLTNGNTSSGFGAIKARFTVSFGSKLPAALESAAAVSAGSKAASLKADYGEASCSKCTIT